MSATPPYLEAYWQNAFDLKQHLCSFLGLDPVELEVKLEQGQAALAQIGRRDFTWEQAAEFYREQIGSAYLLDLAAWHLSSTAYIGDTLKLVVDQARGTLLDFGGGIGTHAIAAARSPFVERVIYWDLNPVHRALVRSRAERLDLSHKLECPETFPVGIRFDTIVCLDVLEHLPDPAQQLLDFEEWLASDGKLVINWYFFKGFADEFPFHLEDPVLIDRFFQVLQARFIEVFHPFLITTRCYRKISA